MKLRIVSDVHGKIRQYTELLEQSDKDGFNTIQIGDLGFYGHYIKLEEFLDSKTLNNTHWGFKGNHDAYEYIIQNYHLKDYGLINKNIFYIRGAFSIDWHRRTPGLDFFIDEELSRMLMGAAIKAYKAAKPEIVLTHDCPKSVSDIISDPDILRKWDYDPETFKTRTGVFLQECLEEHKPKLWIFGHYHMDVDLTIDGTRFICRKELKYTDIEFDLSGNFTVALDKK